MASFLDLLDMSRAKAGFPAPAKKPMMNLMPPTEPTQAGLDLVNAEAPRGPAGAGSMAPVNPVQSYLNEYNSPEAKKMREQLYAQSQASIDEGKISARQAKDLMNLYLTKDGGNQTDLEPLLKLADTWTGSKMSAGYQKPEGIDERIGKAAQFNDLATKRLDDASKNQIALTKQQLDDKMGLAALKMQGAQGKGDQKMWDKYADDIDPNKGRAGEFGKQAGFVNQAKRLLVLADQNPNLDLNSRMIHELALGTAALLSNGSRPAESIVNNLVPHSYGTTTAGIQEWLTQEPTGTGQQAFVKQMIETVRREHDVAAENVKNIQMSRIAQHEHLYAKDPVAFGAILQSKTGDPDALNNYFRYKANGYVSPAAKAAGGGGGGLPGVDMSAIQAEKVRRGLK